MPRKLTKEDVEIIVEPLPEDQHPDDCFALDPEDQKQVVDKILADAEWNEWAWCIVKATVRWKGLEASDYLGGCSYESEEDFVENSGYYEGMVEAALEQLNNMLEGLRASLKELEEVCTS